MASKKKSTYTPAPEPQGELLMRVQTILAVQGGILTVSEAAKRLGMSRNHFQTLMHRGLHALVEAVMPKPAGRPAKPEEQVKLEQEVKLLRAENAKLRAQLDSSKRFLSVATQFLHGTGRQRRTSRTAETQPTASPSTSPASPPTEAATSGNAQTTESPSESDDPDGAARAAMKYVDELREAGVPAELAAATVGCSSATIRRWRRRQRRGQALRLSPGRRPAEPVRGATRVAAESIVRACRGRIGAETLRHAVPALTRSRSKEIIGSVRTALEAERKAEAAKIIITLPNVMRALDGVHVRTREGKRIALPIADSAVPFKTSVSVAARYTGEAVAAALRRDFDEHGAPLFLRMDRAKQHQVADVRRVLDEHGVIVLHGPPRYPCFYGQLERQNRELRDWLGDTRGLSDDELAEECARARRVLNEVIPRRTLGWITAASAWSAASSTLEVDREALAEEVDEEQKRIRRSLTDGPWADDKARRLAIESVMARHGWLIRREGGWC